MTVTHFVVIQLLRPIWRFATPVDCSLPSSSVHGVSQARILEWVAISISRGSFWPRDQTYISCIGRQILYHWATREAPITHLPMYDLLRKKFSSTLLDSLAGLRNKFTWDRLTGENQTQFNKMCMCETPSKTEKLTTVVEMLTLSAIFNLKENAAGSGSGPRRGGRQFTWRKANVRK